MTFSTFDPSILPTEVISLYRCRQYTSLYKFSHEITDCQEAFQQLGNLTYNPTQQHLADAIKIYEGHLRGSAMCRVADQLVAVNAYFLSGQIDIGKSLLESIPKNEPLKPYQNLQLIQAYIKSQQYNEAAILTEQVFNQSETNIKYLIANAWHSTFYDPSIEGNIQRVNLQRAASYLYNLFHLQDARPFMRENAIACHINMLANADSREEESIHHIRLLELADSFYSSLSPETDLSHKETLLQAYIYLFVNENETPPDNSEARYQQRMIELTEEIVEKSKQSSSMLEQIISHCGDHDTSPYAKILLPKLTAIYRDPSVAATCKRPFVLITCAETYRQLGDKESALQSLQRAKEMSKDLSQDDIFELAYELFKLGYKNEASTFLSDHIQPSEDMPIPFLSYLTLSYLIIDDPEHLNPILNRLENHPDLFKVEENGSLSHAGLLLSYAKAKLGDHAQALIYLEKSLGLFKQNLELLQTDKEQASKLLEILGLTRFEDLTNLEVSEDLLATIMSNYHHIIEKLKE